jgi:hypothetical protein
LPDYPRPSHPNNLIAPVARGPRRIYAIKAPIPFSVTVHSCVTCTTSSGGIVYALAATSNDHCFDVFTEIDTGVLNTTRSHTIAVTTVLATTSATTSATISVRRSLGVTFTTAITPVGGHPSDWVITSLNAVTVDATYIATIPFLPALLTAFFTAACTTTDIKRTIESVVDAWIG